MHKILIALFAVAALLFNANTAFAWHARGDVLCDVNSNGVIDENDVLLRDVVVFVENLSMTFSNGDNTNDNDEFSFNIKILDEPDQYEETLDPTTLPDDATIVIPPGGVHTFETTDEIVDNEFQWLIDSAICRDEEPGECWMTGGGAKFSRLTGETVAQKGPHHSFGGNVHPACKSDSGAEGGHWNHVAHKLKLHFKGHPIPQVECGNVVGIPPGSESPVTLFNFIEYQGTGSLSGIKGNKFSDDLVFFFARVEDHNEPGSHGAKAGADIDRYFLHVFDDLGDPAGSTLLLLDVDGDSTTLDPVAITSGNLQLHPCD